MKAIWLAASVALMVSYPSLAVGQTLQATGSITSVEGDAGEPSLSAGDLVGSSFSYDLNQAIKQAELPLGGGLYEVYSLPLTNLSLSIGGYSVFYDTFDATLTYMDDSFGQDAIVVLLSGLQGGPFGSDFANVQFQFRAGSDAIVQGGTANGLPLDRFDPTFFAGFGANGRSTRVFGSLDVALAAVPEPSSWALMILGFGAVGGAMRRRQSVAAKVRFA